MAEPELTSRHHAPRGLRDHVALGMVKVLRVFADAFFAKRYGNRAVVLETIAAVPGMVGGALRHLTSLRTMREDGAWIRALLDEAENERMHLMTFVEITRPSHIERWIVFLLQGVFWNAYFLLYLFWPRTAHRFVGYLEEEAVVSYTQYLRELDAGRAENAPAPALAIRYWSLPAGARLRDVVIAVRADEAKHRDVNHGLASDPRAAAPGEEAAAHAAQT